MDKTTIVRAVQPTAAGRVKMLMFGIVVAVLSTCAISAWAQPASAPAGRWDGHGPGMMRHHGDHGMGGGGMGGMMMMGSPERVGRMVDHLLDGLNATDAQRSQIKQIAQSAAADLKAQREAARGLRERSLLAFTAPTVDANAVESLRQQMLSQHDQATRLISQAMIDVSRVLTPEQRAKIGDRMKERAARMQERMQRMQRDNGANSPPR